jgi:hypothetical protein
MDTTAISTSPQPATAVRTRPLWLVSAASTAVAVAATELYAAAIIIPLLTRRLGHARPRPKRG